MLPETHYDIVVEEDGKKTSFTIKGEDCDGWVEDKVVQLYTKNKQAQLYNKSGSNSSPIHGVAFFEDPSCKCTKTITGNLIIYIEEVNK